MASRGETVSRASRRAKTSNALLLALLAASIFGSPAGGAYNQGRRRAMVEITYSATDYRIAYLDSSFLKHDGDTIHEVYNRWVKQLEAAIDREANFRLR